MRRTDGTPELILADYKPFNHLLKQHHYHLIQHQPLSPNLSIMALQIAAWFNITLAVDLNDLLLVTSDVRRSIERI